MNLPSPTSRTYDNTRLSGYKTCPRSYLLRHVLHFTREGTASPLVFGSAWHAGQDVMWANGSKYSALDLASLAFDGFVKKWQEEGFAYPLSLEMQEVFGMRTPGVAKEMYFNYATQRTRVLNEATVIAIEQPFAVPIPELPDRFYIGKLDKVIQWNQNKVILEHKTTSDYRVDGGFNPSWSDQWDASSQVKGYEFGGHLYFPGLDGVWVDGALVHKKVHDKFKFIPISHPAPMLVEWLDDTKNWIQRIENDIEEYEAVGKLTKGTFPKNEESCYGKYSVCPFLDICRHCPDPTQLDGPPDGFKESKWEPFNILKLDKLLQQNKESTNEA